MNNVLNYITLHWKYILANTETIPGILVNLIVTVDGKYTFLYKINIFWNFVGSTQ